MPNQDPRTRRLFDGSKWQGEEGAAVYKDALRQGPRGDLWEMGNEWIAGVRKRSTLISLEGLYGDKGIMGTPPKPGGEDDWSAC